jgi:hypothetical protein
MHGMKGAHLSSSKKIDVIALHTSLFAFSFPALDITYAISEHREYVGYGMFYLWIFDKSHVRRSRRNRFATKAGSHRARSG